MHSEPVQICIAELAVGALVHLYNDKKAETEYYFLEKSGQIKGRARLSSPMQRAVRGRHFKELSSVKYHIDFSPFAQLALQEQQKKMEKYNIFRKKCMHNLKRPATFYYSLLKRAENNILRYFVN